MDLTKLTDAELHNLGTSLQAELDRRAITTDAPALIDRILAGVLDATGQEPGDEWVQPTGYENAYPKDWQVTHDGRRWTATRHGATGTPGESVDWVEVIPEGVIPVWEQRHAGSEYEPGALVTHNNRIWRNDSGTPNGWEPGTPHSGWTDLGPEGETP